MKEEFYQSEFIEKYLNGQLDPVVREAFEKAMQDDTELAKLVQFKQDILRGIGLLGEKMLDQTLRSVEGQLEKEGFFLNEEHIRQYLMGKLDPQLTTMFENRLSQDEAFVKELNFQKDLLQGIGQLGSQKEEADLAKVEKGLAKEGFFKLDQSRGSLPAKGTSVDKPSTKTRFLFSRKALSIAASILLLIALSIFFLWQPNRYDQLFATYYQAETNRLVSVLDDLESSGMVITDQERRAELLPLLLLYESADYSAAADSLAKHLSKYPNDINAQFYYGQSLMETKKFQQAVDVFTKLAGKSTSWDKEVSWYRALSLLKTKRGQAEAIELFHQIASDEDSPYRNKAAALLEELD